MRTIIYLSAILIAGSINNAYMESRYCVVLPLMGAFAWDMIEMYLKHKNKGE